MADETEPIPIKRRGRKRRADAAVASTTTAGTSALAETDTPVTIGIPQLEAVVVPAEPLPQPSFLEKAKARLGFSSEPETQPKTAIRGRLSKQQQEFADLLTPIARDLGIDGAGWAWGKIGGPGYEMLAPSEEISEKIFAPLVRIGVRHLQWTGKVGPDSADLTASTLALIGYSYHSYRLFRAIKKEQRDEEAQGIHPLTAPRTAAGAGASRPQGHHAAGAGAAVLRSDAQDIPTAAASNGHTPDRRIVTPGNLSPEQQYQYVRLAGLSRQDYAARSRRSGRP